MFIHVWTDFFFFKYLHLQLVESEDLEPTFMG